MKYHFRVTKESKGYSAQCIELEGCFTQADTKKELQKNMQEALNLFLDEPESSKIIFPMPDRSLDHRKGIEAVKVNPSVGLAFMIRMLRLRHKWTQRQAADQMGLDGSLFKYQRLENSKTANPEWKTLLKIKKVFPELNMDELLEG